MAPFDSAHFKEVLGHYVTGIVIVTAMTPEGPAGFTCQTFGSLSIDSALVFFAAITTSPSWQRVRQAGVVGINILADDQQHLARGFAVSGVDKFDGVPWVGAPQRLPLPGGSSRLFGRDHSRGHQSR